MKTIKFTTEDYFEIVQSIECIEGTESHEIELKRDGGTLFVDCTTETYITNVEDECNWVETTTDYEITNAEYWDDETEEMVKCEYDNKEFRKVA